MHKLPVICRDAILRVFCLIVCVNFLIPAHAWNNDYSSSQSYDNYSQPWQNYKQQNNINTHPAYQQSWWNSAINGIGNFFSSVTQAVTNFVTNIGNFCTNIYNNVHDFFVKTPEIKANLATAPPTVASIQSSGAINRAPTLDSSSSLSGPPSASAGGTYRNERSQSAKDNPYAYLTAEKACYDPRAVGLSQFSSQYQAIEAEYAARDKWIEEQKAEGGGKLVDTLSQTQKPSESLAAALPSTEVYGNSKFYDLFPPEEITPEKVVDRVAFDFKAAINSQPDSLNRNIEALQNIGERGVKAAASIAVGQAVSSAVKTLGAGKAVQFVSDNTASNFVDNALSKSEIRLLADDCFGLRNIYDRLKTDLADNVVTGLSYQRSVITVAEADRRNRTENIAGTVVGLVPVIGTVISVARTFPYQEGQIEYKVNVNVYNSDKFCKDGIIELNYRVGEFVTNFNNAARQRGVIEATYTKQALNPYEYQYITEDTDHVPK